MKVLLTMFLVVVMVLAGIGLGFLLSLLFTEDDSLPELNSSRLKIVEEIMKSGDRSIYIGYDTETGVEYFMARGYTGAWSLSPVYDENGNVSFYLGGK